MKFALCGATLFALAAFSFAAGDAADVNRPAMSVAVDASQAAQKIYHIKVRMPAAPGPFTFVYPEWIPGYHGPVGPIEGVVNLHVRSGGAAVDWRRDLVDMYAVHTTVPQGASEVEVDFDVVGAESHNGQIEPVSTSQLALVEYSNMLVYPQGATAEGTQVDASLTLPAGWTYGTALPVQSHSGNTIVFKRALLYTVIDSPVIAGTHEKAFALGGIHELDVASDSAEGIALTPKFLEGMKHLVAEGPALYGGEHYRDYHFLLTLSDPVGFEGIEHHESSDDRAPEKYASDDSEYRTASDLLPHEYSHSWNGKYRRPADLFPPDYQQPEKADLLWVYEGMNQYNGEKLATRARINSFSDELDKLASTAAEMDVESGRQWRPLRDTADGAPFLYQAPGAYYEIRRSAGDFYSEGDLIWLDADVTIRKLTHDKKSLDDFCKLWGNGTDHTDVPVVNGYTEQTVLKLLGDVVPYDWAAFFHKRVAEVQAHAPMGGITAGGYRLVYTDKPSSLTSLEEAHGHGRIDVLFSMGMTLSADGTIENILTQSSAFKAGLAPGMKIVAIDGRRFSDDVVKNALRAHKGGSTPIGLIVANEDFFKTVGIEANQGERYPHLERVAGTEDELAKIYAPRTFTAPAEKPEQPEK